MAQLLIAIREAAPHQGSKPLTQGQAAQRSGLTQSKITRAETGRFPLSPEDAETYSGALQASRERRERLLTLTRAHKAQHIVGRRQLVDNAHVQQRRIADLQASTRTLRAWVPDLVPGILQTRAYTEAIVGMGRDERWWAARDAQKTVLTEPDRDLHLIISEAALRWGLGSPGVMLEQLAHLSTLTDQPPVRLGLVPLDRIYPAPPPRGFYIYGDHTGSQATEVGMAFVGPPEVQRLIDEHEQVAEIAVYGAEALRVIARAEAVWTS